MSSLNSIKNKNMPLLNKQKNLGKKISSSENIKAEQSNEINSQNIKHIHCENTDYEIGNGYVKCLRNNIIIEQQPPFESLSYYVVHNMINILKEKLLDEDLSPNCRDDFGVTCSWTPLYWSVKIRNLEATKILLEFGADINLVIHDFHECCGTVLDLATLREDLLMENILRQAADLSGVNLGQSFKALRTKLRGKAPAFNFRHYGKNSS